MTEQKAISILGTYEFCGFNHTEAKFFATPEDWQEALVMATSALYEKLNHEILNRTESDAVKPVEIDQVARNLHDVASNQQVAESLQRNGFSGSLQASATKNQVKSAWISVEKELPEPFVSVLVYMPGEKPLPTVHEGYFVKDANKWFSHFFDRALGEVTHWMPMLEAPEVET